MIRFLLTLLVLVCSAAQAAGQPYLIRVQPIQIRTDEGTLDPGDGWRALLRRTGLHTPSIAHQNWL